MGDIIGGLIGGVADLFGGSKSQSAANAGAGQSLAGFNYLKSSPVASTFLPQGAAANTAESGTANYIGQLLGVPGSAVISQGGGSTGGIPGGPIDYGRTGQAVLDVLSNPQFTHTFGTGQGIPGQIAQAIKAGATPDQIQSLANQWAQHTTSPTNAAGKAALLSAVQGLTPQQAAAAGGGVPGAGSQPGNGFDNYLNSTGYKFRLNSGSDAITGNAASRGLLNSGATAKALTTFGQNLGTQYFNNYLSQLNDLAGVQGNIAGRGLTAGQVIGAAGTAGGSNAGQLTASGGQDIGTAIGLAGNGLVKPISNALTGLFG